MMARDFPEINHQFDVWHWVKVTSMYVKILTSLYHSSLEYCQIPVPKE